MNKTFRAKGGSSVTIKNDAIENLQSGFFSKYLTQVGILGAKAAGRNATVLSQSGKKFVKAKGTPSPLTNAEIGAVHEYGSYSRKIPRRSFLELPLTLWKRDELLTVKSRLLKLVYGGRKEWYEAYKILGIAAERIVQQAFDSHGFGHWRSKSVKSQAYRKGYTSPLIITGQLRGSISSRVVAK
jgi:phage gpG-like protein